MEGSYCLLFPPPHKIVAFLLRTGCFLLSYVPPGSPSSMQTFHCGSVEMKPLQSYTRSFIKKNMLKTIVIISRLSIFISSFVSANLTGRVHKSPVCVSFRNHAFHQLSCTHPGELPMTLHVKKKPLLKPPIVIYANLSIASFQTVKQITIAFYVANSNMFHK